MSRGQNDSRARNTAWCFDIMARAVCCTFIVHSHDLLSSGKDPALTSEGVNTPLRTSALNLDLEFFRNSLKGAGILPGLDNLSVRGTSTRQDTGPHAIDCTSAFTVGPMLEAMTWACNGGATLPCVGEMPTPHQTGRRKSNLMSNQGGSNRLQILAA